ncbi:hypothetical protein MAM1_0209d08033 [Mucor ambiguus]|uniref:C2H2-type domain-containing protein n=1 Tax=Mucor ambiguus TaxID=91626 RepID=A0A0C9MLV0_9FUNG|nr:hypothetical protein MAM1_0209d08033 [Mucor ambiguus]
MTCLSATACAFNEDLALHEKNNLPSPPNSSCGEEREPELATITIATTRSTLFTKAAAVHYTTDLSENYTIDHSKPHAIQQVSYTLKSPKDHRVASTNTPSLTASTSPSSSSSSSSSGLLKRPLPFTSDDDDYSDVDDSSKATEKSKRKKSELSDTHRCDECGKLYKHLKSLFKHQWEHSEYWETSSKLSLTKHQKVQMLEAASILTGMKKQTILEQQQPQPDSEDDEEDDDDHFEQQQTAFGEGDDQDDEEEISLM